MVTLRQDKRGNYTARKRLPNDVRDEYGRLYGPRIEAKFYAPASTKPQEVKRGWGVIGVLPGGWYADIRELSGGCPPDLFGSF